MDTRIEINNLKKKNVEEKSGKKFSVKAVFEGLKKSSANKNNVEQIKNIKKSKSGLWGGFKILKNKQAKVVFVVLIFGLLALFILNSSFGTSLTSTRSESSKTDYMTSLEYCERLENKLVGVLSKISGAGDVKVMVTAKSGPELILATNTDERTNTNTKGDATTTNNTNIKEPIIVNTSNNKIPIILGELAPDITGVVVVSSGAKDIRVRLNLLEAVKALLDISSNNIQIYY